MNDHRDHDARPVGDCSQCAGAAYEPGWYATLLGFASLREAVRRDATRSVNS